jgi:hypothetical protein
VGIYVTATPNRVPADGRSRSRLRIELRNQDGSPFADGTLVVLHTDLGSLTLTGTDLSTTANVTSRGGVVSAGLVSDTAGVATVTVNALNSRQQTMVEFVCPGDTGVAETRIVRLGGGWTGYGLDLNMVEARDKAYATFGKVRLEGADLLQLNIEQMVLRGGPGTLTNGTQTLEGQDFYLDLPRKRGVLRRLGEGGVERITFDLATLEPRKMEWELPPAAFQPERGSSAGWILARNITVFGGEKIVFDHPGLYSEEKKVMSLPPIWVMGMAGYSGLSNTQAFGLNSSGGLAVRMPYFIGATDHSADALMIEKGAAAGSIIAREDWGLGLVHEYRTGQVNGSLALSGLPQRDWGFEWRDARTVWPGADGSFDLSLPDHRSLYWDGSVFNYRSTYSLNYRTFYQRPEGSTDSYGATAEWLTEPRVCTPYGGKPYLRVGTTVGVQKGGQLTGRGPQGTQEVYGSLNWPPLRVGKRTTLTPSLANIFAWNTSPYHANNLRSELRLDHSFGDSLDFTLRYAADHTSGDSSVTGWQQFLTSELHAYHGQKWMAYVSGSLQLDSGDWYSYATWDYYLSSAWRLAVLGNWYKLSGVAYNDQSLYVGRKILGDREIGLSWSRQTKRLSLELVGLATGF